MTKLQRSRHCLFVRPSTHRAIYFQSRPYFYTAIVNYLSSSGVQGPFSPLTKSGLRALYHLSKHYTLVRPGTLLATNFQFLLPNCFTALVSKSSSSCTKNFERGLAYIMRYAQSKFSFDLHFLHLLGNFGYRPARVRCVVDGNGCHTTFNYSLCKKNSRYAIRFVAATLLCRLKIITQGQQTNG